jgi:hypothetical protein
LKHVVIASALALTAAACGSDGAAADAAPDDARTEVEANQFQVTWGPITVQPGVEDVRCVVVRLGNELPLHVNEITNVLGDVSHHFIVYRTNEEVEIPSPEPCDSVDNLISPDNGVPLMITQKSAETLTLPTGVGFEFEANQMVRLELHYVNASDTPKEVMVTSTFTAMADAEFEFPADLVFIGDPDINIPPGESRTLGPIYFPMPFEFRGSKFFGMTGHEHQWGTNVQVALAETETGPDTMLYDLPDFAWNEPETVIFDPPIEFPELGGFRFTCSWTNTGTTTATFGEGVDDEMCFFWAYYYPSRGARTCFHTEQAGSGTPLDVCCPGDQLCNLIQDYLDQL